MSIPILGGITDIKLKEEIKVLQNTIKQLEDVKKEKLVERQAIYMSQFNINDKCKLYINAVRKQSLDYEINEITRIIFLQQDLLNEKEQYLNEVLNK